LCIWCNTPVQAKIYLFLTFHACLETDLFGPGSAHYKACTSTGQHVYRKSSDVQPSHQWDRNSKPLSKQ